MATTIIPWGDGSGGNIYLTYPSASGDQTVSVSSDANTGAARSKVVTFTSGVGSIVRQLTVSQEAGAPQEYTLTKYPSSYDTTNYQYASMSNASRAYTSYDSTTYATINLTTGSQAETYVFFKFDTSSIPANAVIEEVSCTAKTYCSNASTANVAQKTVRLCFDTTAKGDYAQIATGSAGTQTIDGGSWTREEISDIRLRVYARRGTSNVNNTYSLRLYGATLTIKYTA